jgi:NitT/TauT family transport system substrate-binding protein
MKKYWLVACLVIAVITVWLGASGIPTSKKQNNLYRGKITIGMAPWPGYLSLLIAKDQGYFQQAGLDIDIKHYDALADLSKEYVAGKIQGRANLTLEAVNESLGGLDHRVVLVIDYSNGADAILARQGIDTVGDFKGKKVAYESGTLEEFFLIWALNESNLELSDIIPVNANPEEAAKQLQAGNVDVGVSYEPFISKLVDSGDFHVLYSSRQAPGLITDILTFRTDFIKAHPQTVQAITDIYFKALDFWKENPDQANAIVARELGDTPEHIARQLKGITILDRRDNETAFTFAAGFQSLYGNLRQIRDFVSKHQEKTSDHPIETDQLIDRRFIKKNK